VQLDALGVLLAVLIGGELLRFRRREMATRSDASKAEADGGDVPADGPARSADRA
jgi:hypothetical protein